MNRRTIALALVMLLMAAPVFPCGGPGADVVDAPLVPVRDYLAQVLYDDDFEVRLRPELRFLEPYHRAMPDSIAGLYAAAYEGGGHSPDSPPDTAELRVEREMLEPAYDATARGAFPEAVAAARRAVTRILDMNASSASAYREALRTAVEIVDIAPRLTPVDRDVAARYFSGDPSTRQALSASGVLAPVLREAFAIRTLPRDSAAVYADAHPDSPRLASLRFVALQEAMRAGLPDGWAAQVRDSVPAARWTALERLHDEWLRRFGDHPMADYVRLSKVRLFYFKGDDSTAWNELLAMYPRHRERVLGEMRYLVYQSVMPPSLDDARIDWTLRTALMMEAGVTPGQWTAYWHASEAHAGEPWALAMQERLLWRAARFAERTHRLPAAFPARPAAPTPLWAALRLVALLEAGDLEAAFAQADSTSDLVNISAIRVRLHLLRGDWSRAIAVSAEARGDRSGEYLVRVLAPRRVIDSLASIPRAAYRREALLAAAAREAAAGDWRSASRLATGADSALAVTWARTAALAGDTSRAGRLAFARWMRDHHGRLFFGEDTYWMRGLNWRRRALVGDSSRTPAELPHLDPRLPWTSADERAKIEAHLRATTELSYALGAYADWLEQATATTPGLAAVVREADQVYNRLINGDQGNSPFWSEELAAGREARAIRRAGALLRRAR